MMDWEFLLDVFGQLLSGLPLTLQLSALALLAGFVLAVLVACAAGSRYRVIQWVGKAHIELFRGTPLLVQIFLIYYGLGQIPGLRQSFLWPFLREPYWCAILALALNTSAYTAEIIRGALQAVPASEIEAGRACGMSGLLLRRRVIWPIAVRHGLPVYGSEIILMLKATSLASIITLTEITGIAYKLISSTYRVMEVFAVTGALYLTLTFLISLAFSLIESRLNKHLTRRRT
ncbi:MULTISPECIES: ABC transporter permease [unclassified Pseudomonas]|uniref:ABC transporter permease n=1 Tax=unclassified Pseudomonas TaxID=196821 RepID=UPI000BD8A7DD|nr:MULTISPECIES: ABC transporter permease [unclassified Pseudomonas]PVZ08654.1 octopine/nopaline transport system permease protein [Pseudomonas sp. URIL14HWK12:I12]PVZ21081.1 octopine/nopaline transport system permease protein [Pseudomonas sp. URIL14HWK12:I10]PVZ29674.1 octopine/nopaline transport system permease protein [Pseudomonas sp. URIL14HWK12:I11]SNZ18907.1 amino acid ABC transporter membrane protein 2, PAAT family (TC 3.A.1.3.-) [Pseudomonas sp. URIL14HWK12:I9]